MKLMKTSKVEALPVASLRRDLPIRSSKNLLRHHSGPHPLKTSKSSSQSVEELLEKFSWEEESKKMNVKLKKFCWTVDFVSEIQCSQLNSSNHVRGLRESKKLVILLHAQKLSCSWIKNHKVIQWLENRESQLCTCVKDNHVQPIKFESGRLQEGHITEI